MFIESTKSSINFLYSIKKISFDDSYPRDYQRIRPVPLIFFMQSKKSKSDIIPGWEFCRNFALH